MKFNHHIFFNGKFVSNIVDFKIPSDDEIKSEILEYLDVDLTNKKPKFQTCLNGVGIEFIRFADYEPLKRNERQEISQIAQAIEMRALQIEMPTQYQQHKRNLLSEKKIVVFNDSTGPILGYRGNNYLLDTDNLDYLLKVYVHSRLFDFFNTEPSPYLRQQRFEEITKHLNDERFKVHQDLGYCVVEFNGKFYFLNLLGNLNDQIGDIHFGLKRAYDTPKDLRNNINYEKFAWLKSLGFLVFKAHVIYDGKKVNTFVNHELSNNTVRHIFEVHNIDPIGDIKTTYERPRRDVPGIIVYYDYLHNSQRNLKV